MAITVFSIFQEALTNIIRHANATEVDVKLFIQNNNLILDVYDNGIGITKEQIKHTQSFGIVGIKERVLSLNSKYVINGKKNEGTLIRVKIPIAKSKKTEV